ncbi:hypothetical protein [Prescottella agglutinans]|uniref:Uncharacterized protein n=1 Tax=Prescottella agglutinans TaxID=1644129 RepID=A0ABT6MJ10_9NOCA|nr:hypothetical protein [Prescottella agglutinans]MDH6284297.1 hypothetical protein [Prescottella agglutinans]
MQENSAAAAAGARYRAGGSLDALAWALEDIVIRFEDQSNPVADQLRGAWSDLEITNAMNLSEGLEIDPAEVDASIEEILQLITNAESATRQWRCPGARSLAARLRGSGNE